MTLGYASSIYYFNSEGRHNLPKTVELVLKRSKERSLNKIIVFTVNGEGAFLIKKKAKKEYEPIIFAATFPYKQTFLLRDEKGDKYEAMAETSDPEVRKKLVEQGITIIQGVMPLQDIIIPGAKDVKTQSINYTLTLISGGLRLCVQAILMAADGGYVEPGEDVIALSADTAIIAKSCLSKWLFHPAYGMEIKEIICKPSKFSITRKTE